MNDRHSITRGVSLGLLLLLLLGLLTGSAFAQAGSSSVRGAVMDPQGSVVPNATVTLTSAATGAVRSQKSSATGSFSFELLPPGDYTVEVSAPNFRTLKQPVHALIAKPVELELQLQVGAASESVTVTAESTVQVNTQDSSLGNNFISSQIVQLPMESRNVLSMLTLQPGVTRDGSVAGARSDQSNITLDGVNINDAQTNSIETPVLRLNAEAIEEFRVNTMTNSAAAGRSAGAQINLVTKSGTNQWRGSLFEFHRNTIFSANTWFNNHATPQIPREKLIRNTFGGAVGGPIVKNKLFFFYSFEARRDASSESVDARLVPLTNLGQGIIRFKNSLGATTSINGTDLAAIFPDTGGINAAAQAALAKASAYGTNSTEVGDGLNTSGFRFNAPFKRNLNSHVAKFDYNLTTNQLVSVRGNVIYDHDGGARMPYFPDTKHPQVWSHPTGITAAHTWTARSNLVNSFKYGLTRQAFSSEGDLKGNDIWFRLVFVPVAGTRDSTRVTPVQNFVDDVSLVHGNHTLNFGGNLVLVSNQRVSYGSAWDSATTNPSGYETNSIVNSVDQYLTEKFGYTVDSSWRSPVENAITALLGRYTQYTANFTFGHDGSLLASGVPSARDFATQGYEMYAQDTWKITPNLTVTAGLRYSLWRPVYERKGFEVQPTIPLGEYFRRREVSARAGLNYMEPIVVNMSGPANGGAPMYSWDKTVFLPKFAVAWSPHIRSGLLSRLFGSNGQSVFRGGVAMANDYFGQQIATFFDERNTLGFTSKTTVAVNTFNIGCGHYVEAGNEIPAGDCVSNPGPLFTAYGQPVRTLPKVVTPANLKFPLQQDENPERIESSLDSLLQTPKNYAWSFTFERELPTHTVVQFSYLGRTAHHLLAQRDIANPIDLVDPKSGMDWYTAATILEKARQADRPISSIATIPYFENLFPAVATRYGYPTATQAVYARALNVFANDWTSNQLYTMDKRSVIGPRAFYQPQYGALAVWSTIGNSMYNALAVSVRQRMRALTVDFNYTYSHSLDDASGLQTYGSFSSSALVLNPFRQRDNYASSDFDMRHMINVNSVWQLPFGRGKKLLSDAHGVVDAVIGGWQFSNIFRWNTGIPFGSPYDANTWATNWENQSATTRTRHIPTDGCITRNVETPQFFGGCLQDAFSAFRNAYPGETGERNTFRMPSYIVLDFGLSKVWKMPYREGHELQFRWEVFNATNTQRFGNDLDWSRAGWGIYPGSTSPSPNFSNITSTQGGDASKRVMQFGLRYSF